MVDKKLELLSKIVEAHETPGPRDGSREPLMFIKSFGGGSVKHHAVESGDLDGLDEALLEEMFSEGLIEIDYREHNWNVRPTALARSIVEQHTRVASLEPTADVNGLLAALQAQGSTTSKFSWPAVRPVLEALQGYWEESGFPPHGVATGAILTALPEAESTLFQATVRALLEGDYLARNSDLSVASGVPAEVTFTDRTRAILDGWPGATETELVDNLLAVLADRSANEKDPEEKRRLEKLAETVREIGVSTAGEVLAKVMTGA